jgi:hypothetical protein
VIDRRERDPAAFLYAAFTRRPGISNGPFTRRRPTVGGENSEIPMFDLIYVALAAGGFALFALAVRAADRL